MGAESAREQADRTDTPCVPGVGSIVSSPLVTVLIYSIWRFRAPAGDESDGPPIHGNTKLEVIWTILPTLLLAVVAIWAYLVLTDNEALAEDRVDIQVTAEQFAWTFTYPDQQIASGDLRVPVDRQCASRCAPRVIHDFYVVELGQQDVVPGVRHTSPSIPPDRHISDLCRACGVGLGVLRGQGDRDAAGEYDAWLESSALRFGLRHAGDAALSVLSADKP